MSKIVGWGAIQENSGERADYVKFEAGKKVKLHILDDAPVQFSNHPLAGGAQGRPERCKGANCPFCAKPLDYGKKTRYAISVFAFDTNQPKVLEGGTQIFAGISAAVEAYEGNIKAFDIIITRTGAGLETRYTVVPVPTQYKPDMLKVEKFNVSKIYGVSLIADDPTMDHSGASEEVPF